MATIQSVFSRKTAEWQKEPGALWHFKLNQFPYQIRGNPNTNSLTTKAAMRPKRLQANEGGKWVCSSPKSRSPRALPPFDLSGGSLEKPHSQGLS